MSNQPSDVIARWMKDEWNIEIGSATREQRTAAKNILFPLLYGTGPQAEAFQLKYLGQKEI